jgi:hypothetical protein
MTFNRSDLDAGRIPSTGNVRVLASIRIKHFFEAGYRSVVQIVAPIPDSL